MLPSSFDLTDRVALITGAGSASGIGFASARLLAELGATVHLTSTSERIHLRAQELASDGFRAHSHIADLTSATAASKVLDDVVATSGYCHIVVNNAGMTSVTMPGAQEAGDAASISVDAWHASLARNLDTCFFMCRAALPVMTRAGWGRIVNVASVTGPVMAMTNESAYAAAKAGMVGLTRSIAVDVARYGITVNAVAPGWIATESQTDHEQRQGERTPMQRSASPHEVASAVAWLSTPGASYVTGQCVVVDGANSIAEERW